MATDTRIGEELWGFLGLHAREGWGDAIIKVWEEWRHHRWEYNTMRKQWILLASEGVGERSHASLIHKTTYTKSTDKCSPWWSSNSAQQEGESKMEELHGGSGDCTPTWRMKLMESMTTLTRETNLHQTSRDVKMSDPGRGEEGKNTITPKRSITRQCIEKLEMGILMLKQGKTCGRWSG